MIIRFFESSNIANLYPLTLTRPAADLRCGILTIAEKWVMDLSASAFGFEFSDGTGESETENRLYLSGKFTGPEGKTTHYINGHILPYPSLVSSIQNLTSTGSLWQNETLIACGSDAWEQNFPDKTQWTGELQTIDRPYHIFGYNGQEIKADYNRLTTGRTSQILNESNNVFGVHPLFVEEGAKVNFATLNTNEGPIYIGKNAEIMEGSLVRGPFALCEGAVLKMGTKAYSNSTLGPYSVAGGEISNVVFWGYSNKGHDGFLGNAVIGEWCNLGADTNASNLKNTYDDVKVWNYRTGRFDKSGVQFCGLIMGDHSKCGINTMFNTGTVVGVACNIFGAGFPRNFIADFSWGGAHGVVTHQLPAVDKTATLVMPRRKRDYSEIEKSIIHQVFSRWASKE
jgi:UDP-N-acetylglucosamine diphosphorylase/glucosamine-1-phosphate N-acetyltransferase